MDWPPTVPPDRATLRPPSAGHRRFGPSRFSGWSPDDLEDDIPVSARVFAGPLSDRDARRRVGDLILPMGFHLVEDDRYAWVAERNLLADPAAAKAEMGASRFALPMGGVIAVAGLGWLVYLVLTSSTNDQLAATVVLGLGLAGILGGSVGWTSGCYWSDLVIIDPIADSATRDSPDQPGPRRVTVFLGRALTKDWEIRHASGRSVKLLLPDSTLSEVQEKLASAFGADPPLPPGPSDPATGVL